MRAKLSLPKGFDQSTIKINGLGQRIPVTMEFDLTRRIGTATVTRSENGDLVADIDAEASLAVLKADDGSVRCMSIGFITEDKP